MGRNKKYACIHTLICVASLITCQAQKNNQLNLGFEMLDSTFNPVGWAFSNQENRSITKIDSVEHEAGKYSLNMYKTDSTNASFCRYKIPAKFAGSKIKLTGYVKTKNITNGSAGLWLRIDGSSGALSFDNMQSRGIVGTTDWEEYTINLPYDYANAKTINFGAILTGSGKLWVDNFHLFIDSNAIESAPLKTMLPADEDFDLGGIPPITAVGLNEHMVKRLGNLGKLWGFLKYYHPAIAKGNYNWDAELLKILPGCFAATTDKDFYAIVNNLVDTLGTIPVLTKHVIIPKNKIKLLPDFGDLFLPNNLPSGIVKKLQIIWDNYVEPTSNYYIGFDQNIENPIFKNEKSNYGDYPTVGVRLVSLFRYWNMVQYFFPSRYLIEEDWNKMLPEFIPKFIHAKDKNEYVLACLELTGHIHDTHANIYGNPVLESLRGEFISPFKAEFIEDKLVVTAAYNEHIGIGNDIKIGDVIEQIDNVSIDSLERKWLPFTPASNLDAQLRDLPSMRGFLLRSNAKKMELVVNHNGRSEKISIDRIPMKSANTELDWGNPKETKGYRFINNEIGYIYPAKLIEKDIDSIKHLFKNTKGLVIDLRDYPSTFMPFTYGNWLKPHSSQFAHFTKASLVQPGIILAGPTVANGGMDKDVYKGQVVIIVNAKTQSQAEYTTMALSSDGTNAIVLGSTTAGADGNISSISLPGGIATYISGLGVYNPDLTETQRKGVKIAVSVKPTIKGVRQLVDELLDKAIAIINKGRQ